MFLSLPLVAQEVPIQWGNIPMEHLKMTTFPADSNASAVILCDYGVAEFDDQLDIRFTVHQRIKILSEKGYKEGTVSVPFNAQAERVTDIAGTTYMLDAGNKVVKYDLSGSDIFEENINDEYKRIRFTLPRLAAGAVIEFRYTKTSNSIQLPTWYFQGEEPVLWSEFRVHQPEIFVYETIMRGYLPITNFESIPFRTIVLTNGRGGSMAIRGRATRYVMKNVPALREEPFMTTVKDYLSQLSFDLREVKMSTRSSESYRASWEQLVERHLNSRYFGKHLNGYGMLRDKARELAAGISDTAQKVQRIAEFVHKTIQTKGDGIYADRNLEEVYKAKAGNSAEVNLILTLMLREVGVAAAPVLLSTRSHGRVLQFYPSLSQFNFVITRVLLDGNALLLDVCDETRPIDLLSTDALGGQGLVVDKSAKAQWVSLEPKKKYRSNVFLSLTLQADGNMNGQISYGAADYGALSIRAQLKNKKEDEVIRSLFDADANVKIDSVQSEDKDAISKPLNLKAALALPQAAMSAGEMLYVNPTILKRAKNPLTLKNRYFPIDMAYPQESTYIVNIHIPDGYTIVDSLKPVVMRLPNNSVSYQRQVLVDDRVIQVLTRYDIRKIHYPPQEYEVLREFFDRVVALEAEQIVLQKASAKSAEPVKPAASGAQKKKPKP